MTDAQITHAASLTDRRLVTIQQAMVIMQVSRRTIYSWIQLDKVEIIRTASGRVRIYEDSLWQRRSAHDD